MHQLREMKKLFEQKKSIFASDLNKKIFILFEVSKASMEWYKNQFSSINKSRKLTPRSVVPNRGATTSIYLCATEWCKGCASYKISMDIRPILTPWGSAKYFNNPVRVPQVEKHYIYGLVKLSQTKNFVIQFLSRMSNILSFFPDMFFFLQKLL